MIFTEVNFFVLITVAFLILSLFVFLSCFKMPQNFRQREQMRRALRVKILDSRIKAQDFELENVDEESTEEGGDHTA
ncbi:hypothetical protein CHISP_1384 [Chitinispirillum alkaliphilum]|nr:hypothetical protein CHISP_1384 [Chitinispirillum alkaliphilum]